MSPEEEIAIEKQRKKEARKVKEAVQLDLSKKRSECEIEELKRKVPSVDVFEDVPMSSEEDKANSDSESDSKNEFLKRNMMSISNTCSASIRFGVSDGATAAIVSGFLKDMISAGHLEANKSYLAVDRSKVSNGKEEVIRTATEKEKYKNHETDIKGIFFDGRKDNTKILTYDHLTKRYNQRIYKENHIAVTSEPDGQYRFHFTPGPSDKNKNKPAKVMAQELHSWLVENGIDETVLVLGGDSTNEMTGWSGGAIAWLEQLLERKCFWVVCNLHTNELPLRHLIIVLDGKTSSKDGFSGPIGKKLSEVNSLKRNTNFEAITGTKDVIHIPEEALKKMSTDSALSYRLLLAIRSGHLSPELAIRKCGLIVHCRWLTTGESLMMLWMSDHGFSGETLRKFRLIVNYVVNVYFPMFFEIKVKHSILDGPQHVLTLLQLLRGQPAEVVQIVSPYIQTGAWFAHSESLLLTLLASDCQADRKFAVDKVLEVRGGEQLGDLEPRPRRTPKINFEAQTIIDLIDWEKEEVHEPVFSCGLNKLKIENIVSNPLRTEYFPLHTQSTERAVKLVTEAASSVCGFEKRHGFILSRIESRKSVCSYDVKKNMVNMF